MAQSLLHNQKPTNHPISKASLYGKQTSGVNPTHLPGRGK